MLVVSTREFRNNQKSYLDKIDEGIELLLTRGKNKSYKILPVIEDDTLMSKDEFFAKLDRAERDYAEGRYRTLETEEDIKNLLGL
jgi:hypothetical protein